ncbi:MAG TPA: Smr/MutS family protein [Gemmatimonadaceae bacterium]|nr:Smr/MutS family protein [Gemmatimonadaceae bacterium]
MNSHALTVLEFARVLELVAQRASSNAGAARIRRLTPTSELAAADAEHTRVTAMRALVDSERGWNAEPIPDLERALHRLRVAEASLDAADLLGVAQLLRSARLTRDSLRGDDRPPMALALLAALREALLVDEPAEEAIARVLAEDGSIRDDASSDLRRIRRELRASEGELVALLERALSRLEPHQRVPDMSVTVRNGRYVIPVRREARGAVGGIVHDTSSTGATLFVEPPAAIEACNRIRELEADELREIDRLLAALSERVRPLAGGLADSHDALVELDALFARARFAADFRCGAIQLVPPGAGFRVLGARHPLLVAQGIDVVPFDLEMSDVEHTLLVSGPNTGGKTVLLKTLGLLSLMAQAGVPIPVAPQSTVVVYDDVFADVGDEQSIEASLSTFSAHLRNIGEILRLANARSLCLLDELGSGTDPLEGAALGGAVLEALTRRGAMTVATTHLGALKELASEMPGIVNASLQFDAEAMAPTYLLIKGIPGRSYGLSIARRLQLPEAVLQRAEERVPQVERDVNALLVSLEAREAELSRLEAETRASLEDAQTAAGRLAEREQLLRQREIAFEREARQDTRRYLLEARNDVERTIRELKRTASEQVEDAARAARQQVERMAEDERRRLEELETPPRSDRTGSAGSGELAPGDMVRVEPLNGRLGRLIERREDGWVVAVGAVKMTFPEPAVSPAPESARPPAGAVPLRGELPDVEAPREIDVRGMRAAEIDDLVLQALDAAIRADLRSLRIIHGKGTGALRDRVAEMLQKDTRVRAFRLGAWNEGGAGVTVAEL